METKILEIRDRNTSFAVIAINMNPDDTTTVDERYWLRRYGYPCDGRPNIAIAHLTAGGQPFTNDSYHWQDRTYGHAHEYIINNWNSLTTGDVVDVRVILGEAKEPAIKERIEMTRENYI